jgi:hypothetical protein
LHFQEAGQFFVVKFFELRNPSSGTSGEDYSQREKFQGDGNCSIRKQISIKIYHLAVENELRFTFFP